MVDFQALQSGTLEAEALVSDSDRDVERGFWRCRGDQGEQWFRLGI